MFSKNSSFASSILKIILSIVIGSCSALTHSQSSRPAIKGYNAHFGRISTSPQILAEHQCSRWGESLNREVFVNEVIANDSSPPDWPYNFPYSYRFNCAYYGSSTTPGVFDTLFTAPANNYHSMRWEERGNSEPRHNHNDCPQTEGNPIRVDLGEKIQTEKDDAYLNGKGISFSRQYNSGIIQSQLVGLGHQWTHTYSRHISFGNSTTSNSQPGILYWERRDNRWIPVSAIPSDYETSDAPDYAYAVRKNGKSIYFSLQQGNWVSDYGTGYQLQLLPNNQGWELTTPKNYREIYDNSGRLIQEINSQGKIKTLHYELGINDGGDDDPNTLDQVRDDEGNHLQFLYQSNRLIEINTGNDDAISYTYSSENGLLEAVTYPGDLSRIYHYEDHRLTGITNENNVRYVSWSYDSAGRAISSSSEGGINHVTLSYNFGGFDLRRNGSTGSVTSTNPLEKQTTYHYTAWQGIAQLSRVEGHPTENCVGANKAYTYDDNGFVASKTDWEGNVTTYVHNERGQETSRTEVFGTPQARTITTEWHPEFNLPTRIIEPERETMMTYDENGRLLSREIKGVSQ